MSTQKKQDGPPPIISREAVQNSFLKTRRDTEFGIRGTAESWPLVQKLTEEFMAELWGHAIKEAQQKKRKAVRPVDIQAAKRSMVVYPDGVRHQIKQELLKKVDERHSVLDKLYEDIIEDVERAQWQRISPHS